MNLPANDPLDEQSYSRLVGERLRSIRQQKNLSLNEVETSTQQEFKASVMGAYERGERVIVGVNRFQGQSASVPILRVDPQLEREQVARLQAVRARRDEAAARAACARVEQVARDGGNLMPPVLDAVRALATVGEISDAMRGVFGEHTETLTI